LLLVLLKVPLRLGLGLVDAVQGHLKVIDVLLQFLLHPHRLHFVPRLRVEVDLHRVQRALMVLAVKTRTRCPPREF